MPENADMEHAGRSIHLESKEQAGDLVTAVVDGAGSFTVQQMFDGRFTTVLMPYQSFESVADAVTAVLDHHPDFRIDDHHDEQG